MKNDFSKANIMSDREIEYVNRCLTIPIVNCVVDYEKLLKGEKVDIREKEHDKNNITEDSKDNNTEEVLQTEQVNDENTSVKFARQIKRCKKISRECIQSEFNSEVTTLMQISSYMGTIMILKHINIDPELISEIENDLLKSILHDFNPESITKSIAEEYYTLFTEMKNAFKNKGNIFISFMPEIIIKADQVEEFDKMCFKFLDDSVNDDQVKINKINTFEKSFEMLTYDAGVALGCFLILKNNNYGVFYKKRVNSKDDSKPFHVALCKHFKNFHMLLKRF